MSASKPEPDLRSILRDYLVAGNAYMAVPRGVGKSAAILAWAVEHPTDICIAVSSATQRDEVLARADRDHPGHQLTNANFSITGETP